MHTNKQSIPRHIAIVMDGNGRWARARKLPRTFGHKKGVDSVRRTIRACDTLGVDYLTLFAFSSENWKRPHEEVSALISLFMTALENEARSLAENGIRMRFIGNTSAFPEKLKNKIAQVEEYTAKGDNLTMQIAANYGGRWDITHACRQVASRVQEANLTLDEIDEDMISAYVSTANVPDPDLFIRTGGEKRISNFLLWQLAYAELFFTDILWPDFGADELGKAVEAFANRQRRFGKTGDQIMSDGHA